MKSNTLLNNINISLLSISSYVLIISGLLRNDFLMDSEAEPAYYQYYNNIQRVGYLKGQELNFLLILSALVLVFIAANLIIRLFNKENVIKSQKITAAYIAGFVLNLFAVIISGAVLSSNLTMLCIDNNYAARDLMYTVHEMYITIDIVLIALLIQMIIFTTIKELPVKNKISLMISAAFPYLLYPLFFL